MLPGHYYREIVLAIVKKLLRYDYREKVVCYREKVAIVKKFIIVGQITEIHIPTAISRSNRTSCR